MLPLQHRIHMPHSRASCLGRDSAYVQQHKTCPAPQRSSVVSCIVCGATCGRIRPIDFALVNGPVRRHKADIDSHPKPSGDPRTKPDRTGWWLMSAGVGVGLRRWTGAGHPSKIEIPKTSPTSSRPEPAAHNPVDRTCESHYYKVIVDGCGGSFGFLVLRSHIDVNEAA